MKTVQQNTDIRGSVSRVFESLADPNNQMKFDGAAMLRCEKITEGPIGKGTRFRGDFKGMGTVEYEYSDFMQNKLIEHAVRMPFGSMHHRFEFDGDENVDPDDTIDKSRTEFPGSDTLADLDEKDDDRANSNA